MNPRALVLVVLALTACGAPRAAPVVAAPVAAEPAAKTPDPTPTLELRLRPDGASSQVFVTVTAEGTPAELARWAGAIPPQLSARDRQGSVALRRDQVGLGFERPVHAPLTLEYAVRSGPFGQVTPGGSALDPNHFRGAGEDLLLLPVAFEDRPVPVRLSIDAKSFGPDAGGASSLGSDSEESLSISGRALRRSSFIAGPLGRARFDAPEGIDRAAWLGFTSFDPRQVAAEVAGFRTGARQYFAARSAPPLTLLLVSDARRPGRFDVARRTASILIQVGVAQPWDAPLRLAVYQRVLQEWLGSELAVAPQNPGDVVEPAWFTEGMSRHLARDLAFRFGLLSAEEVAAEVNHLIGLYVTSPYQNVPLGELVEQPDRAAALTQAVVRGALYSLSLGDIDDLLRKLFREARSTNAPVSMDALGGDPTPLRSGARIQLSPDALGPCFIPRRQSVTPFVLGFVEQGHTVKSPSGPARAAGLVDGDEFSDLRYQSNDPSVKVRLKVKRGDAWQELSFLPAGKPVFAQGFAKKPGVKDDDCRRGPAKE
ncbi:MAG: hypothetical protein KC776_23395 [Myxococcales bacterium]|nr:hypothetical protein [Myxococcales bacterium]MCB9575466.1 hypothetical protein [Polyangiaceae bacterium]